MANVLKIWDESTQQYVGIPTIKGTDGKDALTINTTVSVLVEPTVGESIGSDLDQFNRIPEVGDVFLLLYEGYESVVGRSWICTCHVNSVSGQTVLSEVDGVVETTGVQGEPGSDANVTADNVNSAYATATAAQKQTARDEIGAVGTGDMDSEVRGSLLTNSQITSADYDAICSTIGAARLEYNDYNEPWYQGDDLTLKFAAEIAASPYNGDPWAWIKARITVGNYRGIHIKDYIPFTTANSVTMQAQIAGINTYTNYGDTAIGNHIDFITRELWPTPKPINPFNYNNGLIPVETVVSDGISTSYVLTKEMNAIDNITLEGNTLTGYSYDATTFIITFEESPAAGNMTVTGTGTRHPWLACDLYHWLNSLAGQIPNGTGLNPAVAHVDYTQGGVFYCLPQALKNVIVEKRTLLSTRYSASSVLASDNSWTWTNIGKLWLPTEAEVYGMPVWGGTGESNGGSAVQYPVFAGNMNCAKRRGGSRSSWWLPSPAAGNTTSWCTVYSYGVANSSYTSYTGVGAPVCFRIA